MPATTVDRQCGSSQQAVHFAAQGVLSGAYDMVVACGVESMSRVPMGSNVRGAEDPFGPGIAARFPEGLVPQGISAELIAAKWGLSRAQMDAFAAGSHQKAAAAWANGLFDAEVAPLEGVTRDESVRPHHRHGDTRRTQARLLRPGLRRALPADRLVRHGGQREPDQRRRVGRADHVERDRGQARPAPARPPAQLRRHRLRPAADAHGRRPGHREGAPQGAALGDIDLFEVNEAFASVVLTWQQETGADLSRVNVHGGAIALGHPLGASGTRLTTTLVHAMRERGARYGLQTMCEAGGLADAMVIEAV